MKKNQRRKKKIKKLRRGALLDTSIQFERIKFPSFNKSTSLLNGKYRIYSSYYSLYEFKTGIILSLIDYYFQIELRDNVSEALAIWSDKWGRNPKYLLILQSVMSRLNNSINTRDIKAYLRQVEVSIIQFSIEFHDRLSGLMGSFGNDEIVKFNITDRDSFQPFWDIYYNRDLLPMAEFWLVNSQALATLIAQTDLEVNYSKLYKRLKKIHENTLNSDKLKTVNRGVGDAIIAIDCPKQFLLVTTDSSFDILCPALGKSHKKYLKYR